MINTTPADVRAAIEAKISGLTPSGGTSVGTESSYHAIEPQDYQEDPELLAETDLDRGFVIHGLVPKEIRLYSGLTSTVYTDQFDVCIGHQIGEYDTSMDRRDKDTRQLISQVIRNDNRPSGVHVVRFVGSDYRFFQDGLYTWTTLTFEATYAVSSNYGG